MFLQRIIGKPIIGIGRRLFSSNAATAASTDMPVLPPNLHIADMSIFDAPKPPAIPNIQYNFPILNPPTSIPAFSFTKPGSKSMEVELNPKIFGVAIRRDIVHEVVRYHRNKMRQPHKTKRPSELRGSGKKPHAQKGLGKSQAGNRRNSSWIGGFKAHGPVIRDFSIGLNRKVRALGMMIALAAKQREGNLVVFDNFNCETHRTKDLRSLLTSHGLAEGTLLMVDEVLEENFSLASRNMPLVHTQNYMEANVYDIVKREKLAVTARALEKLQQRLIEQYTHQGKRRALLKGLAMMVPGAKIELSDMITTH